MKNKIFKRLLMISLLSIMLLSMGIVVFGWDNMNTMFRNIHISAGETTGKSGYYTCDEGGVCPSYLAWTNVKSEGKLLRKINKRIKKWYGYVDASYDETYATVKASASGQNMQVKWTDGASFNFEFLGQPGVNTTITSYVIYFN